MSTELTKRQNAFVAEFVKDGNATQAAVRAGYSPRSARVTGHRLLTNAALQQRLQEAGELGLETLIDIARNGTNEAARVRAATALIDRALGKAVQPEKQSQQISITFNKVDVSGEAITTAISESSDESVSA